MMFLFASWSNGAPVGGTERRRSVTWTAHGHPATANVRVMASPLVLGQGIRPSPLLSEPASKPQEVLPRQFVRCPWGIASTNTSRGSSRHRSSSRQQARRRNIGSRSTNQDQESERSAHHVSEPTP